MKLSDSQLKALRKLRGHKGQSSYELQINRRTLESLVARELAYRECGIGSIWSPETNIRYRLSVVGAGLLKQIDMATKLQPGS